MAAVLNDIFRVAARMNQPSVGDFVNVYHFKLTNLVNGSDFEVTDDLTKMVDKMYSFISSAMPDGMTFADINVFNVTQNKPLGSYPWNTQVAGGQAADELAAQTAAFIRGTTGFSRNWARKFIGPFTENSNYPGGLIGTPLMNALTNFGAEWLSTTYAGLTNDFAPVVRYAYAGTWEQITGIVLTNIWATIRRRRVGRGS